MYLLVTVQQIIYSRNTDIEIWITSDGRAYLVRLVEQFGLSEVSLFTLTF